METIAHHLGQMFLLHRKGRFIEILHIQILEYMIRRNITEQGDLVFQFHGQRIFRPAHQDVRPESQSLQLLDAGLGGLGLQFPGSLQIRHQGHMEQDGVFLSHIVLELADGLQEGLALNIPHRSAHFYDGDPVFLRRLPPVEPALDLVGDVGDHLHRSPAVIPVALFLEHRPVDLAGGHIGMSVQVFINKPFIMPQVQVCFRAVVGHKNFPVLDGVHGAGVHIDIGIEFLHGHLIPSCLQKSSQGRCRDPFSQAGHHASCHKYILYHCFFPPCPAPVNEIKKAPESPIRNPDAFVICFILNLFSTIIGFWDFVNPQIYFLKKGLTIYFWQVYTTGHKAKALWTTGSGAPFLLPKERSLPL